MTRRSNSCGIKMFPRTTIILLKVLLSLSVIIQQGQGKAIVGGGETSSQSNPLENLQVQKLQLQLQEEKQQQQLEADYYNYDDDDYQDLIPAPSYTYSSRTGQRRKTFDYQDLAPSDLQSYTYRNRANNIQRIFDYQDLLPVETKSINSYRRRAPGLNKKALLVPQTQSVSSTFGGSFGNVLSRSKRFALVGYLAIFVLLINTVMTVMSNVFMNENSLTRQETNSNSINDGSSSSSSNLDPKNLFKAIDSFRQRLSLIHI